MITVYSKPDCQQCNATYRFLNTLGIDHRIVDLTTDAVAFDYVKSLGYQQAPVVVAGDKHWSGFRPDLLDELAQ